MPRLRGFKVGVLNVSIHPHSPKKYVELLLKAASGDHYVRYRGDEQMVMPTVALIDRSNPNKGLQGWLFRGLNLNETSWGSFKTLKELDPQDVPQIPPDVRANFKNTPFVFLPKGHRLFFCARDGQDTFNPAFTAKALQAILNRNDLRSKFGEVSVSVETREETIEEILRIPSLTKLMIFVTLPNDDIFSDEQVMAVHERLKKQNERKHLTTMFGTRDRGLRPDGETMAFMKLATSYGRIEAEGFRDDKKVAEKTSHHPYLIPGEYNPKGEGLMDRVISIAGSFISRFTNRN